jgi:serine/threonine protein phosphatase PrpC
MEDRTCVMDMVDRCMFGIFDGHGGPQIAQKCANLLIPEIHRRTLPLHRARSKRVDIKRAIESSFEKVASDLDRSVAKNVGSTALVLLVDDDSMYVANCGDCRAVLVSERGKAQALTNDHTPRNPSEYQRVKASGGSVVYRSGAQRVGGILAVTRAFGDETLAPAVTPRPEIKVYDRRRCKMGRGSMVILASDGFWDVFTNDAAAKMACSVMKTRSISSSQQPPDRRKDEQVVADALVSRALQLKTENVSVVVVSLA